MNISRVEALVGRSGIKPPRIVRSQLGLDSVPGRLLSKVFGRSCDCAETPSVDGKSRKTCLTAGALTGSVRFDTTCLILTFGSKLTSFPTAANRQNPREQLRVPAAIPHDKPRRAWDPLTWTLSGMSQRERPLRTGEAPGGADTAAASRPRSGRPAPSVGGGCGGTGLRF